MMDTTYLLTVDQRAFFFWKHTQSWLQDTRIEDETWNDRLIF